MAKNTRTYIKLVDTSPRHPKVVDLSDAAFRVWIEAMCYSSEYLTDGVVSRSALSRQRGPKPVAELIGSGLLLELPDGKSLQIHDYLMHQTSRQKVLDLRARRAEAGRKGGANE